MIWAGIVRKVDIMQNLSLRLVDHTSATDDPELRRILSEFSEIFKPPTFNHKPKHHVEHQIITRGQPIHQKVRRLQKDKLQATKSEFKQALELGICRNSKSSWALPIHITKKQQGGLRVCRAYQLLNEITEPDQYPMPNLQDSVQHLHGAQIFTNLDIVRAFNAIPVAEEHIPKTAIITPFGLYEHTRMPFGLRNARKTFQHFVNEIFSDLEFVLATWMIF